MNNPKLIIDTELNTKDAEREVSNFEHNATGKFKSLGKAVGKVGTLAVTAGATATAALVKSATKSYAEYEQLVGGVETLFKKNSDTVMKYAENAYKTAGMSANTYMETVTSFSASLLQGLGGDTKKAAKIADKAIIDMSDNANKMGTSMEMIQNAYQGFAKGNYTMLDNLKLGYGGTKGEMARLVKESGVLGEAGKDLTAKNLDEKVSFDQIIEAIHKVQDNMGITGTTAKEAGDTVEGSINQMKGAWENLVTGLGDKNADLTQLIDNFVDSVKVIGKNLMPVVQQALDGVADLIGDLGPLLIKELPKIIKSLLPKLVDAGMNIVQALIQVITQLIPMIGKMLPDIISTLLTGLKEVVPQILEMLPTLVTELITGLQEIIPQFVEAIPQLVTELLNSLTDLLPTLIEGLIELAVQLVTGLADALVTTIPIIIEKLPEIIEKVINSLLKELPTLINGVIQLVIGIVKALPKIIVSLVKAIPKIIKSVINGLIDALPMLIQGCITLVIELVKHLPEIIMALIEAIPTIIIEIVKAFIECVPQMVEGLIKFVKMVVTKGPEIVKSLFKKIPTFIHKIIKQFGKMRQQMLTVGKNIVTGIWDGIKNAGSWLWDKIGGFCDDIVDGFCGFLGIGSPSKVMRDRVGRWIAKGIYKGYEENDPIKQINKELEAGLHQLETSVTLNTSLNDVLNNTFNYKKIGDAVVEGIANSNLSIKTDKREFARVVMEVQ